MVNINNLICVLNFLCNFIIVADIGNACGNIGNSNNCDYWAGRGYCYVDAMTYYCKKACGICKPKPKLIIDDISDIQNPWEEKYFYLTIGLGVAGLILFFIVLFLFYKYRYACLACSCNTKNDICFYGCRSCCCKKYLNSEPKCEPIYENWNSKWQT